MGPNDEDEQIENEEAEDAEPEEDEADPWTPGDERDWRLEHDDHYSIDDAIADREREETAERARDEELGLDE